MNEPKSWTIIGNSMPLFLGQRPNQEARIVPQGQVPGKFQQSPVADPEGPCQRLRWPGESPNCAVTRTWWAGQGHSTPYFSTPQKAPLSTPCFAFPHISLSSPLAIPKAAQAPLPEDRGLGHPPQPPPVPVLPSGCPCSVGVHSARRGH